MLSRCFRTMFACGVPCVAIRATNLYNMLPLRTAAQLEVLLLVIRYSKEAKLVAMLTSFFAGVDDWIKVRVYRRSSR